MAGPGVCACPPGILAAGLKGHERRNPSFLGGQPTGCFSEGRD